MVGEKKHIMTTTHKRKLLLELMVPEAYGREAGKEARMKAESSHLEAHAQSRESEQEASEAF